MILKDVTDEDIIEMELYIRERVVTILRSKYKSSEINMTDYFGESYAANPNNFQFRIGDKKLIKIIISYVKRIVDDGNIEHFKSKENKFEKKRFQTQSHNSCLAML